MDVVLEAEHLSKSYGSTLALRSASLRVARGSIHAVIGENGAGKSTLVKILSGLTQPDSGSIRLNGQSVRLDSTRRASGAGISTAFQELSLPADLTVAQNFFLPNLPRHVGPFVLSGRLESAAREVLAEWELDHIAPDSLVADLTLPQRQMIEVVRALSRGTSLIVLDEATSSLSHDGVEWLKRQVRRKRAISQTSFVFVSHRMAEIEALCDSVTVLRNGETVATGSIAQMTSEIMVRAMIGRSVEQSGAKRLDRDGQGASVRVLSARGLRAGANLREVSFDLHAGEILGVAALEGQGQRELFLALFGERRLESGSLELDGDPITLRSPRDAISAGIGISLIPESRGEEGVFLRLPGKQNLTMPTLGDYSRFGSISMKREDEAARKVLSDLNVKPAAIYEPVSNLSGGNQQKIVIGKWLMAESRVLLMYDPTRGVDIGTKAEIFDLMADFARQGGAVLFYSSEIDELLFQCDRIMVLYAGQVRTLIAGGSATSEQVLSAMLGSQQVTDDTDVLTEGDHDRVRS